MIFTRKKKKREIYYSNVSAAHSVENTTGTQKRK